MADGNQNTAATSKRRSISDLVGGPTIALSTTLVAILDDDHAAAILFCQLWFWTEGGQREHEIPHQAITRATRLSRVQQQRARKVLVARGWIVEHMAQRGRKRHLSYTLDLARVIADGERFHALAVSETEHRGASDGERKQHNSKRHTGVETTDVVAGATSQEELKEDPSADAPSTSTALVQQAPASNTVVTFEGRSSKRDYRVERGAVSFVEATTIATELDGTEALSAKDLERLLVVLCAARCGWETSPCPMDFATYTGPDCALVRSKRHALKPSEMLMAVLGATHLDTWARERNLTLRQILDRADHYVGLYRARRMTTDRNRATQVFLDVFREAENLAVDDADAWARARDRLVFMQPSEALDWARRMATEVDAVKLARGERAIAERLGLFELAASKAPALAGGAR
jgi:hypothetical protein